MTLTLQNTGVLPPKVKDLSGQQFTHLRVEGFVRLSHQGAIWSCRCVCGKTKEIPAPYLKRGNAKSCGCKKLEMISRTFIKHGQCSGKRDGDYGAAYRAWRSMINRCHTPSSSSYHNYGGRGIAVCSEWRHDFDSFLADMATPPKGYTLERIDVEAGYSKKNCKWVPMSEQHKNKRTTVRVLLDGEEMIQADAARKLGIHPAVLCNWHKGRLKMPAHIDLIFVDQTLTQ